MGSNGPSSDGKGNIFLATGNGSFDSTQSNYSSSSLRLTTGPNKSVRVADFFSPYNQQLMSAYDNDFGVMGSVLLSDQPGPVPHLLVTADKTAFIYLINRDSMGSFDATTNHVIQTVKLDPASTHQNALFFNNTLYLSGDKAPMYAYPFNPTTQQFQITPASATPETFTCNGCWVGGSAPTISANGTSNAILWTVDATQFAVPGPGVLCAYDPADLTHELYSSTQAAGNRDLAVNANKFVTPVVANGHVYVSGNGAVDVYGLLTP